MRRWLGAAAACLCVAAGPLRYLEGPPPAHTGGFGEPTCRACHFDVEIQDPRGSVSIEGLPGGSYTPGARYPIQIRLVRPGLRSAGFQIAVRDAEGGQAGTLQAADDGRSVVTAHQGIHYGHQNAAGAVGRDSARWSLVWVAPPEGAGPIHLHLAANAADGDRSALGDHIYAAEAVIAPGR